MAADLAVVVLARVAQLAEMTGRLVLPLPAVLATCTPLVAAVQEPARMCLQPRSDAFAVPVTLVLAEGPSPCRLRLGQRLVIDRRS